LACTTKRFPSPRASTFRIVRPLKPALETQPQTPTGTAEIVSDDFLDESERRRHRCRSKGIAIALWSLRCIAAKGNGAPGGA
jgi:hypothetical protein